MGTSLQPTKENPEQHEEGLVPRLLASGSSRIKPKRRVARIAPPKKNDTTRSQDQPREKTRSGRQMSIKSKRRKIGKYTG